MLSVIFGKNSDNPIADLRSAQGLVDDLPKNDAFRALSELSDFVELLSFQHDFMLDHRLDVLRLFDEAAQPYVRKLTREYFTPFEINKFHENRLWLALDKWSRLVADAYFRIFTSFGKGEDGADSIKQQLPVLNTRAVHTILSQMKFVCSRYGRVDNTIWTNLALLYRHAEQLGYQDTPVSLYPGLVGHTSVRSEIGALMVWYDSGPTALSPLDMHLVERIVNHYRTSIDIRSELNQDSRLCFVLTTPSEPTRINLGETIHPAIRFIGMPALQAELEGLLKSLQASVIPPEINLGGSYEPEVVLNAARYLLDYVASPPVRRNKRHLADLALNVVDGFDKIAEATGARRNPDSELKTSRWVTDEISSGGFSATISSKGNGGIGIGSLLGIQPQGRPHWGVAVVRRVWRDDQNGRLRIGAEVLSSQVAGVVLNKNSLPGGDTADAQPALWLYERQNNSTGEVQLLLDADTFLPNRSLQIQLYGRNYLLMPTGLQEKGLDYDLAKFRFVVQEPGEE